MILLGLVIGMVGVIEEVVLLVILFFCVFRVVGLICLLIIVWRFVLIVLFSVVKFYV